MCDVYTYARRLVWSAGIPELGIEEVEPIVIDEINLSLGSGPDGYRATFKDIQAYGVSNLTVNQVRYTRRKPLIIIIIIIIQLPTDPVPPWPSKL